jgi:hypothetical protein
LVLWRKNGGGQHRAAKQRCEDAADEGRWPVGRTEYVANESRSEEGEHRSLLLARFAEHFPVWHDEEASAPDLEQGGVEEDGCWQGRKEKQDRGRAIDQGAGDGEASPKNARRDDELPSLLSRDLGEVRGE